MAKFERVIVLGATGMLGTEVFDFLSTNNVPVVPLSRSNGFFAEALDSVRSSLSNLKLTHSDLIVNCIGWIPQRSSANPIADAKQAIFVNSILPLELEAICARSGSYILSILTDCVFVGDNAPYTEESPQDANDLYGLTKRLGEIDLARTMGVRCSIVGRTAHSSASLLDWFLNHPVGSTVNGFANQLWNGVTTRAFARLALGIFRRGDFEAGKFHWLPSDFVSKYELLEIAKNTSGRLDLTVLKTDAPKPKDLRLATLHPDFSLRFWVLAGYEAIPRISDLIEELLDESSS